MPFTEPKSMCENEERHLENLVKSQEANLRSTLQRMPSFYRKENQCLERGDMDILLAPDFFHSRFL